MKDFSLFFSDLNSEPYKTLFSGADRVWDPLKSLNSLLHSLLQDKTGTHFSEGVCVDSNEKGLFIQKWMKLDQAVHLKELDIFIDVGTRLEPSAIIKGPAVIGKNCDIRQGAYVRGNVFAGKGCVIGHATEIKNSIMMDHSEAGHFNYIGDSIVGRHVNMGAGSKLANLQFRSKEEKEKGFIHPIQIPLESEDFKTGMEKLGAIVGDHAELGCNAVLCPGTLIGKSTWVYPNLMVPKGYYPPNTVLTSKDRKPRIIEK
ncbi:MAG: glucose-1-phosphate thymidylyltransferase [Nitrospina sp.]|nr:glucose-1-phosphate thymidylyltransferase [Nitrospina sp.]MBT6716374.1 glucose-1-phosphate thymidylyltransferase [Nitrospina sp.]